MYPSFVSNDVIPITPSDTDQLRPSGIVVCKGAAGNVVVVTSKGSQRTYPISIDERLPCTVIQVLSTGTTATGLYLFPI